MGSLYHGTNQTTSHVLICFAVVYKTTTDDNLAAIYNLLSNAVKFTPKGGHIDMVAKRVSDSDIKLQNGRSSSKDYIQISIKDSGIGLEKENIAKIFQPFEQVENSSSRRFQGTGLGLSLTKSLVELHGGRIWAESEGEDLGAIFSFTLPV